jgi:hypothetical protein
LEVDLTGLFRSREIDVDEIPASMPWAWAMLAQLSTAFTG